MKRPKKKKKSLIFQDKCGEITARERTKKRLVENIKKC